MKKQPAMFVAGEKDGVITLARDALEKMPDFVEDLRVNELIPGVGHWTQQESPEAVTSHMIDFLKNI